ncbi:hypothetical protein [Alteromonas abrolhosensis]|uniref:hypothetical protein n=1 Tax=Alteromonas abrolhosensis TaxID=1892904 RepID=UPI003514D184
MDITSRYLHPNKRGKVQHNRPPILERLNIEHEHWLSLTTQFETCFKYTTGRVTHLEQYAHNQHQQRVRGRQSAMRLLG